MSKRTRPPFFPAASFVAVVLVASALAAQQPALAAQRSPQAAGPPPRERLLEAMQAGNYQAACDGFREFVLRAEAPDWGIKEFQARIAEDFRLALECMNKLGRIAEMDVFREEVVAKRSGDWRVLWIAADSLANGPHIGYLVDGQFTRGDPPKTEGEGSSRFTPVDSLERDRARAMQWMADAMPLARRDRDRAAVAKYFLDFGRMILLGRMDMEGLEFVSADGAWKLQSLTSLKSLPGYQSLSEAQPEVNPGAPVTPDGKPLFYAIPHVFHAAVDDGQRWRYCLKEAREFDRSVRDDVFFQTAGFFHAQFGVGTLEFYGPAFGRLLDSRTKGMDGNFLELDTLNEDETVARLATGVERFRMPEACNYIRLYQEIVRDSQPFYAGKALARLAEIFEDRRQYEKAAEYWKTLIDRRDGDVRPWEERLAQIVQPWGRFESTMSQPGGNPAEVSFRFRNGHSVRLEAYAVDVRVLLADVEAYLKSRPENFDFARTDIADIGQRLLGEEDSKYLSEKVADWSAEIRPRSGHFDKTTSLKTPMSRPGVYLLKSSMVGGNTSAIVLWITDTAIIQKPMQGKQFFFVADSTTGAAVPGAALRFFGWRQTHAENQEYVVETDEFTAAADDQGQLVLPDEKLPSSFRWVVTAEAPNGRFALLGWETFPIPDEHGQEYDEVKAFFMTDRPLYRPADTLRYKFWVRRVSYSPERNAAAEFANQPFVVVFRNPGGEEIGRADLVADEYGGIEGSLPLSPDAPPGIYRAEVLPGSESEPLGQGVFEVIGSEQADFQVTVDAPAGPVKLGNPVRFTISAAYRGGAVLSRGTVRYSVYRHRRRPSYPPTEWDWLYGPGYWWQQQTATWFPGWNRWGRPAPSPTPETADSFGTSAPELVSVGETELADNGTLNVELPTTLVGALYPQEDQEYRIEARVTDRRRIAVAARAKALVTPRPSEAVVWIDRGFMQRGEEARAEILTVSAGTPAAHRGTLVLYRIRYDAKGNPTEERLFSWDVSTDALGRAAKKLTADEPGQYRLAFEFTDGASASVEGGCLFTVTGASDPGVYRFPPVWVVTQRPEYRPGEKTKLLVATDRPGATILLFVRPDEGVYEPPTVITMTGKTAEIELETLPADVPDYFVEATTVFDGAMHQSVRRIVVPPVDKSLNVALEPSAGTYLPGQPASVGLKFTGDDGKPLEGDAVVAVFEESPANAGSQSEDIRSFFWKWTRRHSPSGTSNLERVFYNLVAPGEPRMDNLGVFGDALSGTNSAAPDKVPRRSETGRLARQGGKSPGDSALKGSGFWFASVRTDSGGAASIEFTLPDAAARWRIVGWGLASGTRVGEARHEIIARKNFLLSFEEPGYLVKGDIASLSAGLKNFDTQPRDLRFRLDVSGDSLSLRGRESLRTATVGTDESASVSWTVDAKEPGHASVQLEATMGEESEASKRRIRVLANGIPRVEGRGGVIPETQTRADVTVDVPEDRRIDDAVLSIRVCGSLGGATAEAVPSLLDAPDGGSGQTVARFLPAVLLQKALAARGAEIIRPTEAGAKGSAAVPAGPEGAGAETVETGNPAFDAEAVAAAARKGIADLEGTQLDDGGWGWFYGWGKESDPFDTATVVHGLIGASGTGLEIDEERLARGLEWLKRYEEEQVKQIKNHAETPRREPAKRSADNMDAYVFSVLAGADEGSDEMAAFLERDHESLTSFGLSLYCEGLVHRKDRTRLADAIRTLWSRLRTDDSKELVWLDTPSDERRNDWFGNHVATQAALLRMLVRVDPENQLIPKVVHYILTRRANGTHWNSPFETAWCVESLAEACLKRKAPEPAEVTVAVLVNGVLRETVAIPAAKRFNAREAVSLDGRRVPSGQVSLQFRKEGVGPAYFSTLLTTFPEEGATAPAGDPVKIERVYYKLEPLGEAQEKPTRSTRYQRRPFSDVTNLIRGDLVEVVLTLESKTKLDRIIVTDYRPAGFKPFGEREGYTENDLEAYVEHFDDRSVFFAPHLTAGSRYTVSYRMQAQMDGTFTALPATVTGLYTPEIKANTEEIRVQVLE